MAEFRAPNAQDYIAPVISDGGNLYAVTFRAELSGSEAAGDVLHLVNLPANAKLVRVDFANTLASSQLRVNLRAGETVLKQIDLGGGTTAEWTPTVSVGPVELDADSTLNIEFVDDSQSGISIVGVAYYVYPDIG